MSLRTPLGRARGLGSAKDGTHHWWMQRVTSVGLVVLTLVFAVQVIALTGADHATVAARLGHPVTAGIAVLLIVTALYHLKLGIQVVVEDYVHSGPAKITLLMANIFGCAVIGITCLLAVLKLAFGG